jgi:hypothetical protein
MRHSFPKPDTGNSRPPQPDAYTPSLSRKIPAPTKVVVTEQSNPVVRFLVCGAVSIVLLAAVQPAIGALDEPDELKRQPPRSGKRSTTPKLRQAQSKRQGRSSETLRLQPWPEKSR